MVFVYFFKKVKKNKKRNKQGMLLNLHWKTHGNKTQVENGYISDWWCELFDPLSPSSDKHLVSRYSITT